MINQVILVGKIVPGSKEIVGCQPTSFCKFKLATALTASSKLISVACLIPSHKQPEVFYENSKAGDGVELRGYINESGQVVASDVNLTGNYRQLECADLIAQDNATQRTIENLKKRVNYISVKRIVKDTFGLRDEEVDQTGNALLTALATTKQIDTRLIDGMNKFEPGSFQRIWMNLYVNVNGKYRINSKIANLNSYFVECVRGLAL